MQLNYINMLQKYKNKVQQGISSLIMQLTVKICQRLLIAYKCWSFFLYHRANENFLWTSYSLWLYQYCTLQYSSTV